MVKRKTVSVKKQKTTPPVKRRKDRNNRRDVVVNFLLTPLLLKQLDAFKVKHKFSSRNETMRRLIAFALKQGASIPALPL
jgi:hypothetical protein